MKVSALVYTLLAFWTFGVGFGVVPLPPYGPNLFLGLGSIFAMVGVLLWDHHR